MSERRYITPGDLATMQALREAGMTYAQIGAQTGHGVSVVFEKLKSAGAARRRWRPATDALRQEAREFRAAGLTDVEIARRMDRHRSDITRLIGKRPPVEKAPDLEGVRRGARGRLLTRDPDRNSWTDFALPAGHPTTFGAISSEPWPYRR